MGRATVYGTDPAATARAFEREGAELIHIVDLDGAIAGEPRNLDAIGAIRAAVACRLDVSGGLRTIDSVRAVFAAGADIASIGSAAFLNPGLLGDACAEFPGRIFGSLDTRDGRLAIKGWVETSEMTIGEAVSRFRAAGVAAMIVTDIARDGTEEDLRRRLSAPANNLTQDLYVSAALPQTKRLMIKDEDLCVHCGLCAERCPTAAWDMQKFELETPYAGRAACVPA